MWAIAARIAAVTPSRQLVSRMPTITPVNTEMMARWRRCRYSGFRIKTASEARSTGAYVDWGAAGRSAWGRSLTQIGDVLLPSSGSRPESTSLTVVEAATRA